MVFPGTEQAFLAPLPIRAMSGIGSAAEKALANIGIKTLGQLARADERELSKALGSSAEKMRLRAAGLDNSPVSSAFEEEDPKSVSCERTFEQDLYDRAEIEEAILHIAAMTGRRMRRKGLKGSTVTLKVKHSPTSQHTAQMQLPSPTDDEHVFGAQAVSLLNKVWVQGQPIRLVGVGLSHFDDAPATASLFDKEDSSLRKLSVATDLVRERFGESAIAYGRDLRFDGHVSNTAPMGKSLD